MILNDFKYKDDQFKRNLKLIFSSAELKYDVLIDNDDVLNLSFNRKVELYFDKITNELTMTVLPNSNLNLLSFMNDIIKFDLGLNVNWIDYHYYGFDDNKVYKRWFGKPAIEKYLNDIIDKQKIYDIYLKNDEYCYSC